MGTGNNDLRKFTDETSGNTSGNTSEKIKDRTTDRQNPFANWKAPLYDSARSHLKEGTVSGLWHAAMELSFLGSYMDCSHLLRSCLDELDSRFEKTKKKVLQAPDYYSFLKEADGLKEFEQTGISGYEQAASLAKERKQFLYKEAQRKARNSRLLLAGCLAAAVLVIFGAFFYMLRVVQPRMREHALALEEDKDYTGAVEIYRKLLLGSYAKEANEKIPYLKKQFGYQQIEQGNYEQALYTFEAEEDEDGKEEVRYSWGEALFHAGELEEAISKVRENRATERKREMYLSWSDALEEKEEYQSALDVLRQMETDFTRTDESEDVPDDEQSSEGGLNEEDAQEGQSENLVKDEQEEQDADPLQEEQEEVSETLAAKVRQDLAERLPGLREKRCDAAIAAVTADSQIDNELAYSLGSTLDDLNGILRFCIVLDNAGADLESIFPEGVLISDVSLEEYLPTAENKGLFPEGPIEGEWKTLVFSREEKETNKGKYRNINMYNYLNKGKAKTNSYEIRLLPGSWQKLPTDKRADSWEECSLLLLSDTIFIRNGLVILSYDFKIYNNGRTQTNHMTSEYPLFEAADNVTFYDKSQPDHYYLVDYVRNRPEEFKENSLPGIPPIVKVENGYNSIDYERFWGKSDSTFLRNTLKKGLEKIGS